MNTGRLAPWLTALACALVLAACSEAPESKLAKAAEFAAKNDHKSATIELRALLQKNPDNAPARLALAKSLIVGNDWPTAEKELRKARELGSPFEAIAPLLARSLMEQGQHEKLVAEFAAVSVPDAAGDAEIRGLLAVAYLDLGKKEEAAKVIEAARGKAQAHPRIRLAEARLKLAEGNNAEASSVLATLLADTPGYVEALMLKGLIATNEGRDDEALESYRNVIKQDADHFMARFRLAVLEARRGDLQAAKAQSQQMLRISNRHPLAYYTRALVQFSEKDAAGARDSIQQTLRVAPNFFPALILAGAIETSLKNYVVAHEYLEKVVERQPRSFEARRLLVRSLLESGNTDEALKVAIAGIQVAPDDGRAQQLAATAYVRSGDHARAVRLLESAAAADRNNLALRTRLAAARIAAGDPAKGFAELEAISRQDASGASADIARFGAHMRRREFDRANEALNAIERKQPEDPLTFQLRAAYETARGNKAEARRNLEKALTLQPRNLGAALGLARYDVAEDDIETAKKRIQGVLAKDEKNAQAWLALADLERRANAAPEAVQKLIERAILANPADATARIALIQFHLRRGDKRATLSAAQDAIASLPGDAKVVEAHGSAHLLLGGANTAIQSFTRLAALRPKAAHPLVLLGRAQAADKDDAGAASSFQKALRLEPDHAEAMRELAALRIGQRRHEDAIAIARELQRKLPNDGTGHALEGDALSAGRQWDGAIAAYRQALQKSNLPRAFAGQHLALLAAGRPAEAATLASDWLRNNPKDAFAAGYLAERALTSGDLPAAAKAYETALAIAPDNALFLNNLAWIKGQLKDPKALEFAERAAQIAPSSAPVLDTLGWMLVERGDAKKGTEVLKRATTIEPDQPAIRLHLAKALMQAGDKDGARRELQTLARLGDKFADHGEVSKLLAAQ